MFRDGHERDGIIANDHLLALHRGDLVGDTWLEGLRNVDYFLLFNCKLIRGIHDDMPSA